VLSVTATKKVSGIVRKAPGAPSRKIQKIREKKTTVGERLRPRPISIGESKSEPLDGFFRRG
jgi:hypothetical protein